MNLKDKVAIVTGAGVGIGVEYCKRLAAEGARVVCTDIQGYHAEATAKEIVAAGGDAIGFKADVVQAKPTPRPWPAAPKTNTTGSIFW